MLSDISPDVIAFLKANHVAVLATASASSAIPHCAAVFYATDSHINIYFLTKDQTTKSRNLKANPQAAMVIYEAANLKTAQIYGPVSEVNDPDMKSRAQKLMSKFSAQLAGTDTTPIAKLAAGDYILYRLQPQMIRLGDYKYGKDNTIFDIASPAEEQL